MPEELGGVLEPLVGARAMPGALSTRAVLKAARTRRGPGAPSSGPARTEPARHCLYPTPPILPGHPLPATASTPWPPSSPATPRTVLLWRFLVLHHFLSFV